MFFKLVRNTPSIANSNQLTFSIHFLLYIEPDYFKQFTLIITANLPQHQLAPLADLCWKEGISLLVVRSYGLFGSVRLQLNGHNIIESKTDKDAFDLRIADPFPELEQYCNNINLAELDSLQHAHVPYIVILYKAIQTWKSQVSFVVYSIYI